MSDFEEIALDSSNAVDPNLLIAPSDRMAGPKTKTSDGEFDAAFEKVSMRVGRRPVARSLVALYQASEQPIPADMAVFGAYDLWLITYSLSLMQAKRVKEVGFTVRFPKKPRVTILQVFPHTRFLRKIDGHVRNTATIDLTGGARVPSLGVDIGGASVEVGGKLAVSASAGVAFDLSFSVMTSVVQATGHGDFVGSWVLEKEDTPFGGDQLLAHVIATPRDIGTLRFEVEAYANVAPHWWPDAPVMLRTAPIQLDVELPDGSRGLEEAKHIADQSRQGR